MSQTEFEDDFEPGHVDPYRYEPRVRPSGFGVVSKWMMIVGALMTLIGVVGGFSVMFFYHGGGHSPFLDLLMLAPAGFVLGFAGITGWVISGGR